MRHIEVLATFSFLLFWSAGNIEWLRGWITISALCISEASILIILVVRSPHIIDSNEIAYKNIKGLDLVLIVLMFLSLFFTAIVAGFDVVRFGWSELPWSCFYIGVIVFICATVLGIWAMLEEESSLRTKENEESHATRNGPYRLIRYPIHVSALAGSLSIPLMIGSVWAFVPIFFGILFACVINKI